MIDRQGTLLSLRTQCMLLSISRTGMYYRAREEKAYNLDLMVMIDEEFTAHPEMGVPSMTAYLRDRGKQCGPKRVRRLMRRMGLEPIYPKPKTSIPHKQHKIYPYLLDGVTIKRANHVWSADITYIRLGHGFAYLVAIMDWYSRAVLSWRLSNTMDNAFCCEALDEALSKYGVPDIFNSDQGAQFTSSAFIQKLIDKHISISMDGRGRALDNIFVERLWRTVKYQNVYIKGYQTILDAQQGLTEYFEYYNHQRLHQSLEYRRPWDIYTGKVLLAA